jgi:hypothetical protein
MDAMRQELDVVTPGYELLTMGSLVHRCGRSH